MVRPEFPHVACARSLRTERLAQRSSRHSGPMQIDTNVKPPETAFRLARRRTELAALAVAQHGAVAHSQLIALGFTRHEMQGMARAGWLHRVHHGVYAVGRRSLGRKGRWMAAVLVCGPGALLSHRAAGALLGIRRSTGSEIEITVPTERGRRINGVRTYLCKRLQLPDRTVHDDIPCTSVAMTLLSLAAVVDRRALERACDEAEVQRLFDLRAIDELLARSRGRRGAARLRAVLDEHALGSTLTRSELEERAARSSVTAARRPISSWPVTGCCERPGRRSNTIRSLSPSWSWQRWPASVLAALAARPPRGPRRLCVSTSDRASPQRRRRSPPCLPRAPRSRPGATASSGPRDGARTTARRATRQIQASCIPYAATYPRSAVKTRRLCAAGTPSATAATTAR